jgi:hypothetical protein
MHSADRTTLSTVIDQALRSEDFCEPERGLIVQIVCSALLGTSAEKVDAQAGQTNGHRARGFVDAHVF